MTVSAARSPRRIEIGILTKGKPTLSMALVSLILQEVQDIRIHIVDTSESPIINRDDVVFALRLAFDRGIECGYEYSPERNRAFSVGRLKLLEALRGPNLCFMDDDVVMASSTLALMLPLVEANPGYGFITPFCRNAGVPGGVMEDRVHYSPGGLIRQDRLVRDILLAYYESTVDVLDQQRADRQVWEIAFLTELMRILGRPCLLQRENVVYHLDYRERTNWDLLERQLQHNSTSVAHQLADRFARSSSTEQEALSLVLEGPPASAQPALSGVSLPFPMPRTFPTGRLGRRVVLPSSSHPLSRMQMALRQVWRHFTAP